LGLVTKWRNITREVSNELWIAREILSRPGARTDLDKNLSRFTWSGYCREIGISYIIANRWVNQWFPERLTLESKPFVKMHGANLLCTLCEDKTDLDAEVRLAGLLRLNVEFFGNPISKLHKTQY